MSRGAVAIRETQKTTQTIPIVADDHETDPVAAGFVSTLAKPGGNITGMFLDIPEIVGKLVELLKTALPELRTITVLWDPLTGKSQVVAAEHAARTLGIEAQVREVRPGTLEQTVRSVANRKAHAVVLLGSPLIATGFPKIADVTTASPVADDRADEVLPADKSENREGTRPDDSSVAAGSGGSGDRVAALRYQVNP